MEPYQFNQTEFITNLVKDFSVSVFDRASKLTSQQVKRLKTRFKIGFDEYLSDTVASASVVKTLLYRDFPENIGNIYVDQVFLCADKKIEDSKLRDKIINGKKVIISGLAGSGKSFFVKNLIYTAALEKEKFPIFVELRHAVTDSNSILHYIIENVFSGYIEKFDKDDLDYALKSGLFFIVLDGMDEVTDTRREMFLNEIDFIIRRYDKLGIVITTRPDTSTESLSNFPVYHVQPLQLESACQLVDSLSFDEHVKSEFLPSLKSSIYDTHFDFASNPLLLTMLLITYDQVGNIPSRMHIFYSQAFEALVFKHDLLKSRYRRPQRSGLEINTLRKTYGHFCARTYLNKKFSFSESDLLDSISQSLQFAESDAQPADLVYDLISCYSMLKRDGLYITFVHRSFQEYFCALHIANTPLRRISNAIEHIAAAPNSEQTFSLLSDISPELVIREWALPYLQEYSDYLEKTINNEQFSKIAARTFRHFRVINVKKDTASIEFGATKEVNIFQSIEILANKLSLKTNFSNFKIQKMEISKECCEALTENLAPLHAIQGKMILPSDYDDTWLKISKFKEFSQNLRQMTNILVDLFSKKLDSVDDLDIMDDVYEENSISKQEWFESNAVVIIDENKKSRIITRKSPRRIFDK